MVRQIAEDAHSPTIAELQYLKFSSAPPTVAASFFFLASIILLVTLVILIAILWKCIKPGTLQKLLRATIKLPGPDYCSGNLRAISYLDYRTLKKATNNFHSNNQLGRGGFGPVHQGVLDDGTMIAVKQLSLGKSRQGESEFLTEVRMITSIQHKNLVRLVGCCSEGAQRLLVYEYMKNKSLDSILYGNNATFLNWKTRFQIILGIARGLQYLHEDSNLRIVHRDIKASNILLDDKFHPKIGDFGLARFFPEDQAYLSTTFAGTLGYTAPEYAIKGELSEKADIYSFGVLVLEIISSRKNTDLSLPSEMQYLPEYAWRLYERSKVVDLVDPKLLADGIVESDVLRTCQVAFLCLQPLPSVRPPMSEVVAMLIPKSEGMQSPLRPAFLDRKNRINRILSWESASELHPSPMRDSNSFPPPADKSQESSSEVLPPLLRKFTTFPKAAENARVSGSVLLPSPLRSNSPAFSSPGEESRENVSEFLSSLMQFSASSPPAEKARESVSELLPSP